MSSVGIIIPLLNESGNLPGLLADLHGLHGIAQIIFVDGGSTDDTVSLLRNAGVDWLRSSRGRAQQMNAGAAKLNSDILLFLHADTRLSSGNVKAVEEVMRDPGVAGGRFNVRLSGRRPAFRIIELFINLRSRLTKISTGDQAIFVRREIFERLGGFPDQPLMEDVAFSRRLKREGKIACLSGKLVTSSRRWESHGVLRTVLLMWWLRLRYRFGADPAELKRRYPDTT